MRSSAPVQRAISILICALGGEGGGLLTEWLVDAARSAGYPVQATSIPGVAQRTGATTYYLEIFPIPVSELGGISPVFSLYPVPGLVDLIVSSELLETVRQIGIGMADPAVTQVISSSSRTLTTIEKMQLGDGRLDSDSLAELVRRYSRECQLLDMSAIAKEAGTVVSAVMFGAIAGSGVLPFERHICEAVVRTHGRSAEASLRGFSTSFSAIMAARSGAHDAHVCHGPIAAMVETASGVKELDQLPKAVRSMAKLGYARLSEYQDRRYADLYLARLRAICDAEVSAPASPGQQMLASLEVARYLALWMAFDDVVRVAALKSRTSRLDRVKGEVKVQDGELLRVQDFFKPGIAEIAGLLPATLADRLIRWEHARRKRGKDELAFPLKIVVTSVFGMLLLRGLASLRRLRRLGSRYQIEQRFIERWLASVTQGLAIDWRLGLEIAQCARLIKGYGATNLRGKASLDHIMDHLVSHAGLDTASKIDAIHTVREAALADDGGIAMDQVLRARDLPARPLREVPIRFHRPQKSTSRGMHSAQVRKEA